MESICWDCLHAVPSADRSRGCSWSCGGRLVPGSRVEAYSGCNSYLVRVIKCPQFEREVVNARMIKRHRITEFDSRLKYTVVKYFEKTGKIKYRDGAVSSAVLCRLLDEANRRDGWLESVYLGYAELMNRNYLTLQQLSELMRKTLPQTSACAVANGWKQNSKGKVPLDIAKKMLNIE